MVGMMVEEVLARHHRQVMAAATLTERLGNLLTSVKWTQDVLLWTQLDQQVWGHPGRLLGICLREDPVGGSRRCWMASLCPGWRLPGEGASRAACGSFPGKGRRLLGGGTRRCWSRAQLSVAGLAARAV